MSNPVFPRSFLYPPRGMRLGAASQYVGIRPSKFLACVKDGRFPPPRQLDGCVIWDRADLDAAFDNLPLQERG